MAAALLVIAAAILLLVRSCTQEEDSGSTAIPQSAQPPPPARHDTPLGPDEVEADSPRPGLYVRTCTDDEDVGLLHVGIDSATDSTGEYKDIAASGARCVPTGRDRVCLFEALQYGRYRVRQGAFSAGVLVDEYGFGSADLGCDASCNHRVVVHPREGCATSGVAELWTEQPDSYSELIASSRWEMGEPVAFDGMPCGGLAAHVRGGTCAPWVRPIDSNGLLTTHQIDLYPPHILDVWVTDHATGAPIPGAKVVDRAWFRPEVTDQRGHATLRIGEPRFQAAIVTAKDYAGYDLIWDDIAWDEQNRARAEVELRYTRPLRVLCVDDDQPCARDTFIRVDGYRASRDRRCTPSGVAGTWICAQADGDRVDAHQGTRHVGPVEVPAGAEEMVIALPSGGPFICFDLSPDQVCEAGFTCGNARSRPQTVRTGERVYLPDVADDFVASLRCGELSWHGLVSYPPNRECINPTLDPPGSICGPPRRACKITAVSPRWAMPTGSLTPCSDDLPAGRYEVSCTDMAGVEVEVVSGETSVVEDPSGE